MDRDNLLESEKQENVNISAQRSVTTQWIKNPNFQSPIDPWSWKNGSLGDNSDMDGTNRTGQADFRILGETRTFSEISGIVNSSTSLGWLNYTKSGYLTPENEIDQYGILVAHHWDETAGSGSGQIYNYPAIHFRKNISLNVDMSDYTIKSASLEVEFNASVDANIDTPNDNYTGENDEDLYSIGDFATFYVLISDIDSNQSFNVAFNRTKYLGQSGAGLTTILNITTKFLTAVAEEDLITAINAALERDQDHSNFSITLGIDIYSEDNDVSGDHDDWDSLRITTCNFSFTYEKKIDPFTTVSWNQIGDKLNGSNTEIENATFNFKYKVNRTWSSDAPLSELKFYINNKSLPQGIFKLSSATTSFQYAKPGGFDVTNLISTDVNISTSFEVFLKDSFDLNETLLISIVNITLNISYVETFPDYYTDFRLFLNDENKTSSPVFQVPINNLINITFNYINQSKIHIPNATIQLEGKITGVLSENITFQQYAITVNTSQLGLGVSILTINAQKSNYQTQNIQIFVEVIERPTQLRLFVNGDLKNDNSTITSKFNEPINVTVYYKDNETNNHISNANVDLLGVGSFNEINSQYSLTLNTADLQKGINIYTIYAQLNNYTPQSIQFFIEVYDRETELFLYINSEQKFEGDIVQIQINELLNLTVLFRDFLTQTYIIDASVTLLGVENLTRINDRYTIIISTDNLTIGTNVLTIFSQLTKFDSKTIQFFVEVVERVPNFDLFLNGIMKSNDPVFELPINSNLNITIKYFDNQTESYINTAILQLIGEGLLTNFIESITLQQYSIVLNTSALNIGINLFTILAQAPSYEDFTLDLRITIARIGTSINTVSGESLLNAKSGENFRLKILLNNTDFGGIIRGATISFTWEFGLGELSDPDNDGIYEIVLPNVRVGSHIITITAFVGDLYDFEVSEIVLNVVIESELDFTWLVISLTGGIIGLVTVFIFYQKHFKYPPLVRKIRKLKKNLKKGKKVKPILFTKREDLINNKLQNNFEILPLDTLKPKKINNMQLGEKLTKTGGSPPNKLGS